MRKPKIIFLHINMENEIKKQQRREVKKTLDNMQNDLYKLINSDDEKFEETLTYIRNTIEGMNTKDIKNLYKEYSNGIKDCNKLKKIANNEVAISLVESLDINTEIEDKKYSKINTSILNIFNKIHNFLNKKSVKVVMGFAIVLFFGALALALHFESNMAIATIAPMSQIPEKINTAYTYIKTLGFVVAFVFLAVELIQSGLKGDTRGMAMIFAKYLMFAVALLSFKAIYDMIDVFFNS